MAAQINKYANRRIRLACHRLPHIFANPNAFDPSRFAPPREEDKQTRYALVTFGAGARICIGVNFAQIVLDRPDAGWRSIARCETAINGRCCAND